MPYGNIWINMKRGIAGSMIFTLFDRAALYQLMAGDTAGKYSYYAHEGEMHTIEGNTNVWDWANEITSATGAGGSDIVTTRRHAEYMDQIMPFNVTLIAQNELDKPSSLAA